MNFSFNAGVLITVTFFGESMALSHIVSLSAAMQSIPQNTIPYIGTTILNFHCFTTKMLFLFCKSIIPEDFKSAGPHLSFPGVKTRFKASSFFFFRPPPAGLLNDPL